MEGRGEEIVEGVVARARQLLRALDREDRLETAGAFVGWLGREREQGRLPDAAREVFLKALRAAGDPVSYRVLGLLDPLTPAAQHALMERTGLSRVALVERVHDLIQAGLATRELIGDEVRATPLAMGLLALVERTAKAAGERLQHDLGGG